MRTGKETLRFWRCLSCLYDFSPDLSLMVHFHRHAHHFFPQGTRYPLHAALSLAEWIQAVRQRGNCWVSSCQRSWESKARACRMLSRFIQCQQSKMPQPCWGAVGFALPQDYSPSPIRFPVPNSMLSLAHVRVGYRFFILWRTVGSSWPVPATEALCSPGQGAWRFHKQPVIVPTFAGHPIRDSWVRLAKALSSHSCSQGCWAPGTARGFGQVKPRTSKGMAMGNLGPALQINYWLPSPFLLASHH